MKPSNHRALLVLFFLGTALSGLAENHRNSSFLKHALRPTVPDAVSMSATHRNDPEWQSALDDASRDYLEKCSHKRGRGFVPSYFSVCADGFCTQTINYSISVRDGRVQLHGLLPLLYPEATADEQKALRTRFIKVYQECLRPFFYRNGIELRLSLWHGSDKAAITGHEMPVTHEKLETSGVVNLYQNLDGRYDSSHWSFDYDGEEMPEWQVCSSMIHEFAHNLGLPDEYRAENAPNRKVLEAEDNPMSHGGYTSPEKLRFYLHHLEGFLKRYCGPASGAVR